MKRISEILSTHRHAIIWTACYIMVMWTILYFLFRFNMFSGHMWHHLFHAQLHGFAGFVFGILILAALPLYIASTTLIVRTKKPLITIPKNPLTKLTNRLQPVPVQSDRPTDTTEKSPAPETANQKPSDAPLPDDLPAELHVAFMRARNNLGQIQKSSFNSITHAPIATPTPNNAIPDDIDAMPLPSDFDISASDTEIPTFSDIPTFSTAPTFTEINFDDAPTTTADITTNDTPLASAAQSDTNAITEYLTQNNIAYTANKDIITTDKYVIASHCDPDFWVADNDNWFASGRVRPSPVQKLLETSTETGLSPVLYLECENIMDIENLKKQWSDSGIRIITTLSEL